MMNHYQNLCQGALNLVSYKILKAPRFGCNAMRQIADFNKIETLFS